MLKGKSVIELTDIRTNKKEIYNDENLITNAVPDLLRLNPSGLMYPIIAGRELAFSQEIFPIVNKLYGGILLFEDPLEEDVNNIIPPSDNSIIGYASDNINSTDNSLRGSANLNESSNIEGGYKFVWDFSTSQANGKISSIALTHYRAGRFYYGNSYSRNAYLRLNFTQTETTNEVLKAYLGLVEANTEKNIIISMWPKDNKTVEILKFREAYSSIGLTDTILDNRFQKIENISIDISEFFKDFGTDNTCCFYDGKDGYWYGFITSYYMNSGLIGRVKIDKKDYSTKIDRWNLKDFRFHNVGKYDPYNSNQPRRSIMSVIKNGYLYAISRDSTKVYKININNPVDASIIDLGFRSDFFTGGSAHMYHWGDHILGYDFQITKNDKVIKNYGKNYNGADIDYLSTPTVDMGPLIVGYGSSADFLYKNIYLHTPYLGTINNLSSPILKTADKTMKITYTLTEEE